MYIVTRLLLISGKMSKLSLHPILSISIVLKLRLTLVILLVCQYQGCFCLMLSFSSHELMRMAFMLSQWYDTRIDYTSKDDVAIMENQS